MNLGGILVGAIGSLLLLVFGEGLLITAIFLYGKVVSFIIFFGIFEILCAGIIYSFFVQKSNGIFFKIRLWVANKKHKVGLIKNKILRFGSILTLAGFCVIFGILVTTALILLLGYKERQAYLIMTILNVVFFVTWIAIYGSSITILNRLI